MSSTLLFFVRHGQTQWNAKGKMMGTTDIPLNTRGKKQAQAIGKFLKEYPLDIIYSSPLKRSFHTAKAIHSHHKSIPLIVHEYLKEQYFGDFEGISYEKANSYGTPMIYSEKWFYPFFKAPNAESLTDVSLRASIFYNDLTKTKHKKIAIVSHGTLQRVLMATVLGIKLHEFPRGRIDNTSLSIIEIKKGVAHLQALNITSHLGESL